MISGVGESKYGNTNINALEEVTSVAGTVELRVKVPGVSGFRKVTKANLQKVLAYGLPSDDHTATGPSLSAINAGATIAIMQLLYLGSGGKWLLADATAAATATGLLAIALAAGEDTEAIEVAMPGSYIKDETWDWTPGAILYVSETTGEITATAPDSVTDAIVRIIGYAVTADIIFFNPSNDYVTLT